MAMSSVMCENDFMNDVDVFIFTAKVRKTYKYYFTEIDLNINSFINSFSKYYKTEHFVGALMLFL